MTEPTEPRVLILAASLDPGSRSYLLAEEMYLVLERRGIQTKLLDLRTLSVPMCDGSASENDAAVLQLREAVREATHLLFAVPVYNWDVNAAAKDVIEWMTGADLNDKTVGFLCAAGGQSSYMSVMSFANSLMLDFRCWIVPRFVYAVESDFSSDGITNPTIKDRIVRLSEEMFHHLPVSMRKWMG